MPLYCAAGNCNSHGGEGVSMHMFPHSRPKILRKWIKFVQAKRKDFPTATKFSCLCSDHFAKDDFANSFEFEMGFTTKLLLKPDAVPSVHKNPPPQALPSTTSSACDCAMVTRTPFLGEKRSTNLLRRNLRKSLESHSQPDKKKAWTLSDSTEESPLLEDVGPPVSVTLTTDAGVQTRPQTYSRATQTNFPISGTQIGPLHGPQKVESATQTDTVQSPVKNAAQCQEVCMEEVEEETVDDNMDEFSEAEAEYSDDEWDPSTEDTSDSFEKCQDSSSETDTSPHEETPQAERKYIVFQSALRQLLLPCPSCRANCKLAFHKRGSAVVVSRKCGECGNSGTWSSQPKIRQMYAGNLMMSAAILFSGALASKILRFLDILRVARVSRQSHFRHQRLYLHPTVHAVWDREHLSILQTLKEKGDQLVLAGDGRSDSPGHCAKFGGYNVLECTVKRVVDVQVVQSNEVSSSNACELEGLKRSLEYLAGKGLTVGTIITDRHRSVAKFIRENLPRVKHYFDTWHVAKGLGKKLDAYAGKKGRELVGRWRKSIVNHLYWCAASTPDGDGDLMLEKWCSILNHMINVHHGHSEKFPSCQHEEIDNTAACTKDWFDPGTEVYAQLTDIIEERSLMSDIKKLSPVHQTSSLEAFHSLIISFAPKHTAFSYLGMRSRLRLAALHFNENADKRQLCDSEGSEKFTIIYPKAKKGDFSLKRRQEEPTYEYTEQLMEHLLSEYARSPSDLQNSLFKYVDDIPESLCASYPRPNKDEVMEHRLTRYST